MGLLKKYGMKGGAYLLMCAVPLEAAYHGIRRTRYAGDRYAVPIQTHFFNRPKGIPLHREKWFASLFLSLNRGPNSNQVGIPYLGSENLVYGKVRYFGMT